MLQLGFIVLAVSQLDQASEDMTPSIPSVDTEKWDELESKSRTARRRYKVANSAAKMTGSSRQSFVSFGLLMLVLLCIGSWAGVQVASATIKGPTLMRIGGASGISEEGGFQCAVVIDKYIIFGTYSNPAIGAKMVVFQVSGSTLTRIGSTSANAGEGDLWGAVAMGQYVIVGTGTEPGHAVVFQLSGGTLTRIGSASGN